MTGDGVSTIFHGPVQCLNSLGETCGGGWACNHTKSCNENGFARADWSYRAEVCVCDSPVL